MHMTIVSDALPEINDRSATEMKTSFLLTRWKWTVSRCEESFSPWREELLSHQLSENSLWDLKAACPDVSSECCLSQAPSFSHAIVQAWNDWHRMTQPQGDLSSTYREGCCMRTENKSVAGTRELCQCAHQATSPTDTAGNRFRFSHTPGHLGWSGLRKPALCCLSEAWISSRASSWHFSFIRRFFSYSFSSLMAGR